MNSNQELKNRLTSMLGDLKAIKVDSRDAMFAECVTNRLSESLASYYHDLSLALENLNVIRDSIKAMRKLNKI